MNGSDPGPWVRLGQGAIFLLAITLLVLHTIEPQLRRWGDLPVTVDTTSVLLLLFIALAAVLPRVSKISLGKEGAEVDLDTAERAVKSAQDAAEANGTTVLEESKSLALSEARRDPLASIELSRRSLAGALRELAKARGIGAGGTSIAGLAQELRRTGVLDGRTTEAIQALADAFQEARRAGTTTEAYALDIDYATSIVVAVLRKLTSETDA